MPHRKAAAERLRLTWVPVIDARGRVRMEAHWTVAATRPGRGAKAA